MTPYLTFTMYIYLCLTVNRYSIHGETDLEELELNHLDGYRGSKPVRIGNGAAQHLQLDIYGGYSHIFLDLTARTYGCHLSSQ